MYICKSEQYLYLDVEFRGDTEPNAMLQVYGKSYVEGQPLKSLDTSHCAWRWRPGITPLQMCGYSCLLKLSAIG